MGELFKKMNKWHLFWIIPLTILVSVILWETLIVRPSDKLHWDLTFQCLKELYNLTITP